MMNKCAMKLFSVCLLLSLLGSGCRKPLPPKRIIRVGSAAMGSVVVPRSGEGELCRMESVAVTELFSELAVEVLPFDHRVFRMVLTAAELPGEEDVLLMGKRDIERAFNIVFTAADANTLKCELPGTVITLRRAFASGVRALEVEFFDRELGKLAAELKASPRYAEVRRERAAGMQAALICRAIEDFIMDMGDAPLVLDELLHNSGNSAKWNGPYYSGTLPPSGNYRRTAPGKYEFFILVNGKPIKEDILL